MGFNSGFKGLKYCTDGPMMVVNSWNLYIKEG